MGVLDRFSLRGKIALVTAGAGPLFGRSISCALAEAGATLLTASRSRAQNEAFAAELRSQGYDAHGLEVDICSGPSRAALFVEVVQRFGRLDVLVNSALARDGHRGRLEEQTEEHWLESAQGDYAGLLHMCQLCLEQMVAQRSGSIINISSIYGVVANDPHLYDDTDMVQPPTYNFVKAGMVNYTRYLATYYGRYGVRANCLSPGGYFNDQPPAFVQRYEERVPLGRMMRHEDLQGAVVFLASDASYYVTGHNLLVDGGWTAL